MNKRTDHERLLADVLAPEADSGFSSALLSQTLHAARRQRRNRQVRRYGGAVAVLLTATLLVSSYLRRAVKPEQSGLPPQLSYQLVVSQPLSANQLVGTRPLAQHQMVFSAFTADEVRTAAGGFREVGDDELMALASPQVVALVRRGPHEAELVFVSAPPVDSDSRQN